MKGIGIYELTHEIHYNCCPNNLEDYPLAIFNPTKVTMSETNLKVPKCAFYYIPIVVKLRIDEYTTEEVIEIRYILIDSLRLVKKILRKTAEELSFEEVDLFRHFYGSYIYNLQPSVHDFVVIYPVFFFETYKNKRTLYNLYEILKVISKHGYKVREDHALNTPNLCFLIGENTSFDEFDDSIENFKNNPLVKMFEEELRKIFAEKWHPIKDGIVAVAKIGPLAVNIISIAASAGTNVIGWIGLITDIADVIPILLKRFMHDLRKKIKLARFLGFPQDKIKDLIMKLFQGMFEFGGIGLDRITELFKDNVLTNEKFIKLIGPKKVQQAEEVFEKIELFTYYTVSGKLLDVLGIGQITKNILTGT